MTNTQRKGSPTAERHWDQPSANRRDSPFSSCDVYELSARKFSSYCGCFQRKVCEPVKRWDWKQSQAHHAYAPATLQRSHLELHTGLQSAGLLVVRDGILLRDLHHIHSSADWLIKLAYHLYQVTYVIFTREIGSVPLSPVNGVNAPGRGACALDGIPLHHCWRQCAHQWAAEGSAPSPRWHLQERGFGLPHQVLLRNSWAHAACH